MKYSKWVIVIQLFIIAMLVGLLAADLSKTGGAKSAREDVLIHFDRQDLNRMKETIQRFSEGKGDNIMLIQPTIDSGRLIYDYYSDGRELHWVEDHTRDAWSGSSGKTEYVCKAIELGETNEFYNVVLSKCANQPSEEKLNVLSFRKDRL